MSGTASDELLERIDQIGPTNWSGEVFRYTTARRDPLSGAGARIHGGRWNPPGLFPAVYLASPESACIAELDRAAQSQGLPAETLLRVPYKLHTLRVAGARIFDLTGVGLEQVGLTGDDVAGADWEPCQAVGHGAWFLHFEGLLADSASGVGRVLALFEGRLRPGVLELVGSEDLTLDQYRKLRGA